MGAMVGPFRAGRTQARALAAGKAWVGGLYLRLLGPCSSMPGPPFISPMDGVRGVGDPARPCLEWAPGGDGRARGVFIRITGTGVARSITPVEVILVAGRAGSRPVRYQGSDGSTHSDGGRARALSVSRVGRWLRTAWAE